jgi:hypothetical protein
MSILLAVALLNTIYSATQEDLCTLSLINLSLPGNEVSIYKYNKSQYSTIFIIGCPGCITLTIEGNIIIYITVVTYF